MVLDFQGSIIKTSLLLFFWVLSTTGRAWNPSLKVVEKLAGFPCFSIYASICWKDDCGNRRETWSSQTWKCWSTWWAFKTLMTFQYTDWFIGILILSCIIIPIWLGSKIPYINPKQPRFLFIAQMDSETIQTQLEGCPGPFFTKWVFEAHQSQVSLTSQLPEASQHSEMSAPKNQTTGGLKFGHTQTEGLSKLVGGWTNPFEKYESKWESSPIFGVKIKHIWNHHLVNLVVFVWHLLWSFNIAMLAPAKR